MSTLSEEWNKEESCDREGSPSLQQEGPWRKNHPTERGCTKAREVTPYATQQDWDEGKETGDSFSSPPWGEPGVYLPHGDQRFSHCRNSEEEPLGSGKSGSEQE